MNILLLTLKDWNGEKMKFLIEDIFWILWIVDFMTSFPIKVAKGNLGSLEYTL